MLGNNHLDELKVLEAHDAHHPIIRFILLFCAVILIMVCVIAVTRGYNSYYQSVHQGSANATRLTHTLSDHIRLTFLAGDSALKRAIDRQYFNTLFGNNLSADMRHNFQVWVNETPQISAMLTTDKKGRINAIYRKDGYQTWLEDTDDVEKLPFFTQHKNTINPDLLYVGWQNSWIANHDGFVTMSRRISDLDGSFAGVITIAINNDYIHDFFYSIESNKKTKLILLRDDGEPLINQIDDGFEMNMLNEIIQNYEFDNKDLSIQTTVKVSDVDDELRQFSIDNIPNLHMALAVITYGDDIFATWRANRINDLIFLAIFSIFILVIYFLAIAGTKQMLRMQRSEKAAVMASQAKSDFLANMSHELRTPLNAIIGFSEMIEAGYFGTVNAKQKERIHDIHFCGTHLLELINDILEFSKGEAGKIELHIDKVKVAKIITESVRVFTDKARNDDIKVISNFPDDLPLIMADARKIKQILLNLLSNAVKFTERGGTVEASCAMDSDNNMIIAVTDTGTGISEKDIPKALSTFGQTHEDVTKGGTGLGLPLCKMFAELHGGYLTIQSIVGMGTKVSITIPSDRVIWENTSSANLHLAGVLKNLSTNSKSTNNANSNVISKIN